MRFSTVFFDITLGKYTRVVDFGKTRKTSVFIHIAKTHYRVYTK